MSGFVSMRLIGSTRVLDKIARAGPEGDLRLGQGLRRMGETIRIKSMRLVPVDTGRLKSTAFVRQHRLRVEIGYGTDYALMVHEIPPDRAMHRPPTQWKYLEQPAREVLGATVQTIQTHFRGIL